MGLGAREVRRGRGVDPARDVHGVRGRAGAIRRGLTLLELVLAIGLMVLMMGFMFSFYETSLSTRERGTKTILDNQLCRTVAMKIADEIRSANGFLIGLGPGISGNSRIIKLQTVVLPDKEHFIKRGIQDAPPPASSDIRQVAYYLAYDDTQTADYPDGTAGPLPLGLVRREIKTLNQVVIDETRKEDVGIDLFAPEIKYLRLRYFDGVQWLDGWDLGAGPEGGMGNSLPQAVEVTVGYEAMPPPTEDILGFKDDGNVLPAEAEYYAPEKYTVVVRLAQADTFFGSRLMRATRKASSDAAASASGGDSGGGK